MRYRDLITLLFLIATCSWLWAKPIQEVKTPPQSGSAIEGWEVPNLDLRSSSPETSDRPAVKKPRPKRDQAWLDVQVFPGKDLDSTWFEVALSDYPAGPIAVQETSFSVLFEEAGLVGTTPSLRPSAPNRWRFQGSELAWPQKAPNPERLRIGKSETTFQISSMIRNPKMSRFSRGVNFLLVESESIRFSLR